MEAYLGAPESFDTVTIEGSPRLCVKAQGGYHGDVATASIAVNTIPKVLAATPGLHTMRSLALLLRRSLPASADLRASRASPRAIEVLHAAGPEVHPALDLEHAHGVEDRGDVGSGLSARPAKACVAAVSPCLCAPPRTLR